MMEMQKAIEKMKKHKEWGFVDDTPDAIELAITSMEKQIPMKIKEIHVDEYYCPSCGAELNCNDAKVQDKYCSECGQKFEVGDEDEKY